MAVKKKAVSYRLSAGTFTRHEDGKRKTYRKGKKVVSGGDFPVIPESFLTNFTLVKKQPPTTLPDEAPDIPAPPAPEGKSPEELLAEAKANAENKNEANAGRRRRNKGAK